MKMTLCIPFMNQLSEVKGALGSVRFNTSDDTEFMIIDNGSTDNIEEFFLKYLKPKRINYIRNESNIGMIKTMQQAYENCTTEVLAIIHNDVMIYEKDWDKRVLSYFETIPMLGAASFFGAQGCGPIGERIQITPSRGMMAGMSNMLEAEIHGMRLHEPYHAACIFDGLALIYNMEMLRKGNGFDQRYQYHHIYDRDSALESLRRGYKNIVVNVACHHLSGVTANRPEYQTWIDKQVGQTDYKGDQWTHTENSRLFKEKWQDVLPIYVNDDFTYSTEYHPIFGKYKGDMILKI